MFREQKPRFLLAGALREYLGSPKAPQATFGP
jgi:hypothetical protein